NWSAALDRLRDATSASVHPANSAADNAPTKNSALLLLISLSPRFMPASPAIPPHRFRAGLAALRRRPGHALSGQAKRHPAQHLAATTTPVWCPMPRLEWRAVVAVRPHVASLRKRSIGSVPRRGRLPGVLPGLRLTLTVDAIRTTVLRA